MRLLRGCFALAACIALAACGGGALPGTTPNAVAPPPQRAKTIRVRMHVRIPRMPRGTRGRKRRPFFVAASVQGIGIAVYPHGNRTTPLGTANADVSPSSPLCQASAGGRDCTVPIPAPPGNDDFVVTAYDAPPSGGSFSSAKKLATGESTTLIAKGKSNAVTITLGGIVAGIAVSPPLLSVRAIAPSTQNITVTAVDADGDAIVSDGYVDANGNPVSIALSADSSAGTTVSFAPASLASPSPIGVSVTYASTNATSGQIKQGFSSTLTAASGALSATATLSAAAPVASPYPIPGGSTFAQHIAAGPDGALWYTTFTDDTIGRMTPAGAFSASGMAANPTGQVAPGNNNAMWFTENAGEIGYFSVASPGTVNEIATPPEITMGAGITKGPPSDAASMWFTDPVDGLVARIPTSSPVTGSIEVYGPSSSMIQPGSITAGPDGNLWFDDCTNGSISTIPPNSPIGTSVTVTAYPIPAVGAGGPSPVGIAVASDGSIWFADPTNGDNGEVGRITTAGAITEFDTSAPANSVAVGPDGAVWYVMPTTNTIGRIDIKTHTIDEFPSVGDGPGGIALGPDNALYIIDHFDSNVLRVQ
jgi:virginiamycin B lyase